MKKQEGFTLIELMVVMAIIAILATAGLSAYTGYIKKARDATRLMDIKAINNIVLASLGATGKPPASGIDLDLLVKAMNNGKGLFDPLLANNLTSYALLTSPWTINTKNVCMYSSDGSTYTQTASCAYTYQLCDDGYGYLVGTTLESSSNKKLFTEDITVTDTLTEYAYFLYQVGSCKNVYRGGTGENDYPQTISASGNGFLMLSNSSGQLMIY